MEVFAKSAEETKSLGRKIAVSLTARTKNKQQSAKAEVFALTGDLGSGKTTFIQGFAEGLGIKSRIISPTFIILRKYDIPINHQSLTISHFYHIDLYRLEKDVEKEIINLGVTDVWEQPENVVAIEWAEKIKDLVPKGAVWIKFENLGEEERRIQLND